MERIDSLTVVTVSGPQTVTYEGPTGARAWTWRDASGRIVATQPNVSTMVAYKARVTA